jgi:hypothetical protein
MTEQPDREQHHPDERTGETLPEGSAKEFAEDRAHPASRMRERTDGLGKGFAAGQADEDTERAADHGVPEGSGKQFARGEARETHDDTNVGPLSKGFGKGQADLAGQEDPETAPDG